MSRVCTICTFLSVNCTRKFFEFESKNGNDAGLCKNKSSLDKMTETDYSTTDDDSSFDRSQANFEGTYFDANSWMEYSHDEPPLHFQGIIPVSSMGDQTSKQFFICESSNGHNKKKKKSKQQSWEFQNAGFRLFA